MKILFVEKVYKLLTAYCGYHMHNENDKRGDCALDEDASFDTRNMKTCTKENCVPLAEYIEWLNSNLIKEDNTIVQKPAPTAPQAGDVIAEMDKAVHCLAIQLPESVYDDVKRRWDAVVAQLRSLPTAPTAAGDASEQQMIASINEDLEQLDMHELGKVYKYIRTHIIANIPGLKDPMEQPPAAGMGEAVQKVIDDLEAWVELNGVDMMIINAITRLDDALPHHGDVCHKPHKQHGIVCTPCPETCGTDEPEKCKIVIASKGGGEKEDET